MPSERGQSSTGSLTNGRNGRTLELRGRGSDNKEGRGDDGDHVRSHRSGQCALVKGYQKEARGGVIRSAVTGFIWLGANECPRITEKERRREGERGRKQWCQEKKCYGAGTFPG